MLTQEVLEATTFFVDEYVNLQFHNSNWSFLLSVMNFLEERL